jgi:hypothetical protein
MGVFFALATVILDDGDGALHVHRALLGHAFLQHFGKVTVTMTEPSPSQRIDQKIASLGDWRGAMMAHLRNIILSAHPEIIEAVKWVKPNNPAGVPVWEHSGIICTGETYKDKVKLTFANGAALPDPSNLFNSSLDGNVRRAIDLMEDDNVDDSALKTLVAAAARFNEGKRAK